MLKFEALLAGGKYQEALAESRGLTVQGDAMAPEVLTARAQALYHTGGWQRSHAGNNHPSPAPPNP